MKDTLKKWRRSLNKDLRREDLKRHNKLRGQLAITNATKLGDMLQDETIYERSSVNNSLRSHNLLEI